LNKLSAAEFHWALRDRCEHDIDFSPDANLRHAGRECNAAGVIPVNGEMRGRQNDFDPNLKFLCLSAARCGVFAGVRPGEFSIQQIADRCADENRDELARENDTQAACVRFRQRQVRCEASESDIRQRRDADASGGHRGEVEKSADHVNSAVRAVGERPHVVQNEIAHGRYNVGYRGRNPSALRSQRDEQRHRGQIGHDTDATDDAVFDEAAVAQNLAFQPTGIGLPRSRIHVHRTARN
jgi:hypothetical protein